jgi:hypothetical protein
MACTQFLDDIGGLKMSLSRLYAAVAPEFWRHAVDRMRKLKKYVPGSRILCPADNDPWSSIALVGNIPSHLHRDTQDAHRYLSGLGSCGSQPGCYLVIYPLRLKFRYTPRDGILVNTFKLPHFVNSIAGHMDARRDRFSVSLFNHQDLFEWILRENERRAKRHQRA